MPLFDGYKRVEGSRSNTALIKSGHMSPAEDWVLDPAFNDVTMSSQFVDGVLFYYEYGGQGQQNVVIPKGRMVGVTTPIKEFSTQKFMSVITLPGLAVGGNTIGMAPYSFTKDMQSADRFGGNQPSIITSDYVILPYIPSATASATFDKAGLLEEEAAISTDLKMPWGAVIGDVAIGDYVKATPSGRLAKWDRSKDNAADIVGQILAQDFNQEQWGWLKWIMWNEQARNEDDVYVNRSGASNLPSDAGYPFDPAFAEGNTIFQQYQSKLITNPTGIPGLHDGSGNYLDYGRNDTTYTKNLGNVPAGTTDTTEMIFQLTDYAGGKLQNIKSIQGVTIGGTPIETTRVQVVDSKNGLIKISLRQAEIGSAISVTFTAFHYGTSAYLDFKGVVGSYNILLLK